MAALGLLLILGGYLYWTWPVYPASERELDSFSELRDTLKDYDATKDYPVVDLEVFGASFEAAYLQLDGRTRNADPVGYIISGNRADGEPYERLSVKADPLYGSVNIPFEGTAYRDAKVKESFDDTPTGYRYVDLSLQYGKRYVISAVYKSVGMTEEEIAARDAELMSLLYELADRIIDETPAA